MLQHHSRKRFFGIKLRQLREREGLTQAKMASRLEISTSYLNQLENNQRPISMTVLKQLESVFQINLYHFSDEEADRLVSDLKTTLRDPLFKKSPIDFLELQNICTQHPEFSKHFLTLYRGYNESRQQFIGLAQRITRDEGINLNLDQQFAHEMVRDFFYDNSNYIDSLDHAAEMLHLNLNLQTGAISESLQNHLSEKHKIRIKLPDHDGPLCLFNSKEKTLFLSNRLSNNQKAFQLAYQIALLEQSSNIDQIISKACLSNKEADSLCRVGLANYFAGAVLLPYQKFLDEAKKQRYDIERLQLSFDAGFEQICHRLSTLQRKGRQGVPFYFVRVDIAGNISKRQSATSFHFARVGGVCPLWNVHEAFVTPGKIVRQLAETPDNKTYLCIARTVEKQKGGFLSPHKSFAIGLGCEIEYAHQLVYSAGIDLRNPEVVVPIGPSCRVCERKNCPQRAFPPIGKEIVIDEHQKYFEPYRFYE